MYISLYDKVNCSCIIDEEKYNDSINNKKSAKSQETTESQSETMPITSDNVPTIALSGDIIA